MKQNICLSADLNLISFPFQICSQCNKSLICGDVSCHQSPKQDKAASWQRYGGGEAGDASIRGLATLELRVQMNHCLKGQN